jgi:UDP-glucose-4-epimerase GalE
VSNVLVTGGAGYIGSHVCKSLKIKGYTPIVVDNLIYGHESAVKWGDFVKGDLLDKKFLDELFIKYDFSSVIHLAAFAYVGESVQDPAKYYNNNIIGAINLMNTMLENNVKKLIFSSTCSTYGSPKNIPIDELHTQIPINPYGYSKLVVETILKDYSRAYNFQYVVLRYFNAAGADPENEIGESHEPETHLIPLVIKAALDRKYTLKVFGDDYETNDGTAIRDYVHVSDLADAHTLGLSKIETSKESYEFNLGTGTGLSVMEIIKGVELVIKKKVKYKIMERREGDPPILIADSSYANKILGWSTNYSNPRNIIETAFNWHTKNKLN